MKFAPGQPVPKPPLQRPQAATRHLVQVRGYSFHSSLNPWRWVYLSHPFPKLFFLRAHFSHDVQKNIWKFGTPIFWNALRFYIIPSFRFFKSHSKLYHPNFFRIPVFMVISFFSPAVHKFLPKPSSNKDLSRWRIDALRFLPPLRLSVVLLRLLWVLRVLRPVLSGLQQRV